MNSLEPDTSTYEIEPCRLPPILIFFPASTCRQVSIAMSEGSEREENQPAADSLPGVSDELRRLAAALTRQLRPGQTLQATALVHEAYMRLVGDEDPGWEGRRYFFGAAPRAIRQF